ncbi:MAG: hypothetical protein IJF87_04835 [Erysipelotrichaceae bacterium]|nr:hypothetical protein [Erysipelotrichaceae bacterium]
MKVTYIYQDGVLVETENASLIFNYSQGKMPKINKDKPLFVFISGSIADNYNQDIFHWGAKNDNVYYVVANDNIKNKKFRFRFFYNHIIEKETLKKILFTDPDQTYKYHGLSIKTLDTCDGNRGCAFLVKAGKETIFHAGHLNEWSWPNMKEEKIAEAVRDYHKEVNKIADTNIDAAFLILNPSQEEMYAKGFDYFMRKCNVKEVYPIHFKDDRKIINFLLQDPVSEPYRDKIRMTPDYTF